MRKYWKMREVKGMVELECPNCGGKKTVMRPSGRHRNVTCTDCGKKARYRKADLEEFMKPKKRSWCGLGLRHIRDILKG